jgi:hypothetical protein
MGKNRIGKERTTSTGSTRLRVESIVKKSPRQGTGEERPRRTGAKELHARAQLIPAGVRKALSAPSCFLFPTLGSLCSVDGS